MAAMSSRDHGLRYVAYFCLSLLFAISVTYHTRTAADGLRILLHSNEHVRDPFEIDGSEMALILVQPEARAAGMRDGDLLAGIRARRKRNLGASLPERSTQSGRNEPSSCQNLRKLVKAEQKRSFRNL